MKDFSMELIWAKIQMAAAMIDRIVHHGRLVEFTGASHRMEATLMLGKAVG